MPEPGHQRRAPSEPPEVVGSFGTYDEAQRAVDFLADRGVPVREVQILSADLCLAVERWTAFAAYGRPLVDAAVFGAVTGAMVGAALGIIAQTAPPTPWVMVALAGLALGAMSGTLVRLVTRMLSRRARTPLRRLRADRYEVIVSASHADAARPIVNEMRRRFTA
jgi:hypothetical protein